MNFRRKHSLDESETFALKLADKLSPALWTNVVQLFVWDDGPLSRPRPVGSGVLVKRRESVFIFSAAHVLAEFRGKPISTLVAGTLVQLEGEYHGYSTGNVDMGNHQTDPVDAAIVRLPQNSPTELMSRALDVSEIQLIVRQEVPRYLLLGLPANRTSVDRVKKEISSEQKALIYSELDERVYSQIGYDRQTHLVLQWRSRWKDLTGYSGARHLAGSSGGAIWCFDLSSPENPARLVATLTECRPVRGRKVLVGTRIGIHLELLRRLVG